MMQPLAFLDHTRGAVGHCRCARARRWFVVLAAFVVVWAMEPRPVFASCLTPPGDVNASGATNVADAMCVLLVNTWVVAGSQGSHPTCLAGGLISADINCDGVVDVSDVQLVIRQSLGVGFPQELDFDQNGCVDECELGPDSDGDGVPDNLDCEPENPLVFPGNTEKCNGFDDNCDGVVDEGFAGLGEPCDGDSDGCVAGIGQCSVDGMSVHCPEPHNGQAEVCDGVDNDGDGCTDEGFSVGGACDGPDGDQCEDGAVICGGGAAVCSDSPLLRWPFSDGQGAVVADVSGYGRDGTVVGGPVWEAGPSGGSLRFSGNQWVDAGAVDLFANASGATWMAWVRTFGAIDSSYQAVVSSWASAPTGLGFTWSFGLRADGVYLRLRTSEVGTLPSEYRCHSGLPDCGPLISIGGWHFVAATFEAGEVKLYVDGQLAKSFAAPGASIAPKNANALLLAAGEGDGTGNSLNGNLDALALFPRALSADEIEAHYRWGLPATDNIDLCNGLDDDCDGLTDEDSLTLELCNGLDDDCDGEVDEGFSVGQACDGPDSDLCENGTWTCAGDWAQVVCENEAPQNIVELCNGEDDDCDGVVDNGFGVGEPCDGPDSDLCANGTWTCATNGTAECVNEAMTNIVELCNGIDDDCDGLTDEGFPTVGVACDGPDSDLCANGAFICNAEGTGVVCGPETITDIEELCNGFDDDCDGFIDEDFPGLGEVCDGPDSDECENGFVVCDATGQSTQCSEEFPSNIAELCNGIDDDCDGLTDEDFPLLGQACNSGGGATACEDGMFACAADGLSEVCVNEGGAIFLLDELQGSLAIDATGNGNQGQVLGGASWSIASQNGAAALTLPGGDTISAVRVPGANLASHRFTFATWVFPIFDPAATVEQCFISRTSAFSDNGIAMCIDGTLWFEENYSPGVVAPINQWTHVAVTYDGAALQIYGNGALVKTVEVEKPFLIWTSDIWLGQEQDCINGCFDPAQAFKGRIDDMLWLNRPLSSAEVAGLVADGVPEDWANYEFCDGIDNNCDGLTDEGYNLGEACDGPDSDLCENGTLTCAPGGVTSECINETMENIEELCNGQDDNCNGFTDDGFVVGGPCDGPDSDLCANGTVVCTADGTGVECADDEPSDLVEICNGLDDDCDGLIDEDYAGLGLACDGPDSDQCENGQVVCTADGAGVECGPESIEDIEEICNGLDDDCDGETDEGFAVLGDACDGPDEDFCENGTMICTSDGSGVECGPEDPADLVELCNGLDDDCDGQTDEGFAHLLDLSCDGPDSDLCQNGLTVCTGDGLGVECGPEDPAGIVEVCNGLDDDCDGLIDEHDEPSVNASCDDSDPCTMQTCELGQCVYAPNDGAACEDGDLCTEGDLCVDDQCVAGAPVDCDDNNLCTVDACEPAAGCVFTPSGEDCDDNNPCTHDSCLPAEGCVHTPANLPCDDGDPCTLGDACHDGVCVGPTPNLDCEDPPGVICHISGEANDEVVCPIQMVRRNALVPLITALQVDVHFQPAKLAAVRFEDELCIPEVGCFGPAPTPPTTLSPSGHSVALNPANPALWVGQGRVLVANLNVAGGVDVPINEAFLASGTVDGDPHVVDFVVRLQVPTSAATPALVALSAIRGTTADAQLVTGVVEGGLLVMGEAVGCLGDPASCNDDNECTEDTCDEDTGQCENLPLSGACDDGNACTLGDTCDGGVCVGGSGIDPACTAVADDVCAVWGPQGTTYHCPIRLVRTDQTVLTATGLQFDVSWPSAAMRIVRFWDEVCFGEVCAPVTVPPDPLYPSGHSVLVAPEDFADWQGSAGVLIANFSEIWSPISEAYSDSGDVVGDPVIFWMELELLQAVEVTSPLLVQLANFFASHATASFDLINLDVSVGAEGSIRLFTADP